MCRSLPREFRSIDTQGRILETIQLRSDRATPRRVARSGDTNRDRSSRLVGRATGEAQGLGGPRLPPGSRLRIPGRGVSPEGEGTSPFGQACNRFHDDGRFAKIFRAALRTILGASPRVLRCGCYLLLYAPRFPQYWIGQTIGVACLY